MEATSPVVSAISLLVSVLPVIVQGLLAWLGGEGMRPIDHPLPRVIVLLSAEEEGLGSTAP